MGNKFLFHFQEYTIEILPALALGFFLSGLVKEFIPKEFIEEYLSKKGIKSILFATIIGTLLPVCCYGALPIAMSFYLKGASLAPIFAFLVATPATSINALVVAWRFLGFNFTLYIFFAVILMGITTGLIFNLVRFTPKIKKRDVCPHCKDDRQRHVCRKKKIKERVFSVLRYAYIDMPKEIGKEIFLGIFLASLINSIAPLKFWIKSYLKSNLIYFIALIAAFLMYMCATMSIPLVHALINQGLSKGVAFVLLIFGPITNYGPILVIKKEFGLNILLIYLLIISILTLLLGYGYSFLD